MFLDIVGGDFAVDAAELDKLPDFVVVCGQRRWLRPDAEVELGAHYDVVGKADDGGLNLGIRSLGAGCFGWDVMDIGYSFRRHGDLVHAQAAEVSDAASKAAIQDEGVFDLTQFFRDFGVQDFLEFFLTEEYRLIVHYAEDSLATIRSEATERGLCDFVFSFKLIE